MLNNRVLRIEYSHEYPRLSILLAMALILASPFVSPLLRYGALAICLYRVFVYDAKIFATDYVLLAPLARIFKTSGGLTLLIILCLIAALVYLVREGIKGDRVFLVVIALLNYLMIRMQMNFGYYMLCFGQLLLLWILLPKQDAESAVRTAKAYCISLIAVSIYALLLNKTWQIQGLIGAGAEAIWGTGIMRFHGLIGDPNFYMSEVIVGLALLAKLRETGHMKLLPFILMAVTMAVLGALTYSKTFLLAFLVFGGVYILWVFRNKKIVFGILLVVIAIISAEFLLFSEKSPFAVAVTRLLEGENLDDLTTGRSEVFRRYGEAISASPSTLFFGYGFNAPILEKTPHNIYLEIVYHCGLLGLGLISLFIGFMISTLKQKAAEVGKQGFIARYVVLGMVLLLFLTLNGIFMVEVYPSFFLALLAILIPTKENT